MKKIVTIASIVAAVVIVIAIVAGTAHKASPAKTKLQKRLTRIAASNQLSPFTAMRFDGDKVLAVYEGSEYEVVNIDDLPIADMLNFCRDKYKDMSQKRFAEDLVVVFSDMGHRINADHTVGLTLIDPKTGEKKTVEHAVMTNENRQRVHDSISLK